MGAYSTGSPRAERQAVLAAMMAVFMEKRTEGEYKNLPKRYRNILTRGEKELPPIPPRQNRRYRAALPYCRISSYLQTMAHQGYNPLVAVQMALSGQIYADRGE